MNRIFMDTVGLLALWNESDQWHSDATRSFNLLKDTEEIWTTNYIFLECGNAAARTSFRNEVDELRIQMEAAQLLIRPTEDDWQSAWNAYRRGESGQAGIVDHISFVVMRRLGINRAFTNDQHFRAAGFEVLF